MEGKGTAGAGGERIAAEYLRLAGYRIIETNHRTGHLEIDIIAELEGCLVFVEVRTRRSGNFGDALSSVDRGKVCRIRRAAGRYLSALKGGRHYDTVRIDVIGIDIRASRGEMSLRHIRGAA
ncbi:MAG TPA: YraN family protein [Candidatus Krumholzibacterium sp.]|nr:YraN family protein [Candidatus Krumholzibacterium sp.]